MIITLKTHWIVHKASQLYAALVLHLNNSGNEILVLQIISQVIMIFVCLGLIKISLGKHPLQEEVLTEQLIHNSPWLVNKARPFLKKQKKKPQKSQKTQINQNLLKNPP